MASERDLWVAQLCVERGYATPQQVQECLSETDSSGETMRPLEAVLRRRGYISEDAYQEISRHERRVQPPPLLDPEVEKAALDPRNRFGKYILLTQLGAGGMGIVYKAWQTDLRRVVALKFIRGMEADKDLERFVREAQLAATLSHPGIAPIYESGEHEGKHYFAMQYVEGATLDRLLASPERPPIRKFVEILAAAAEAVEYAHEHSIVHRDLKPQNIMVDPRGRAFVMDFGLAKSVRTGSSLTGSGFAVGTPAYMSPEQAQGEQGRIDARSDVYGLGAILYQVGAGRPPFEGDNAVQVLVDVVNKEPVPPRRLNAKLHPELETIALKALDKDPDRRYPSAGEFAADLRRWLDGEPILARPAGTLSRIFRRIRKHKVAAAGVAALLLSLVIGGSTLGLRFLEKSARRQAMPFFQEAAKAYSDADRIRFLEAAVTGHYHALLGRAEKAAREAVTRDPEFADGHFLLAQILRLRRHGDEEALLHYGRATQIEKGHLRAYLERGLMRLNILYSRYGLESVSLRTGGNEPRFFFKPIDEAQEAARAEIASDLEAASRLTNRIYEKALLEGAADFARWRPGQDALLERVEERLTEAASMAPNETYPLSLLATVRMARGDAAGAAEHMLHAIKLAPNDPALLYATASTLSVIGRLDEAIVTVERAIGISPESSQLRNVLGIIHTRRENYDAALEAFQAAIERDPKSAIPYSNSAYAHFRKGRYEEALKGYEEALRRDSRQPDYFEARGVTFLMMNRLEEAEADLDRVVAARPDAGGYSNRGAIRSRRGRYEQAMEDYQQALKLSPDNVDALFNLGILYQRQGKLAEAANSYARAVEKGFTTPKGYSALAQALLKLKRYSEAEEALSKVLEQDPKNVAALADRGQARSEQGKLAAALEDYLQALRLQPDHAGALRDIGIVYSRQGKHAEALPHLERAIERGKTDVGPLLGDCLFQLGRLPEAEAAFTRALERQKDDRMAIFGRAQVRRERGRRAEALEDVEAALRLAPDFAEALGLRGIVKLEEKRYKEAAQDLKRAIEMKPALKETFQRPLNEALRAGKPTDE